MGNLDAVLCSPPWADSLSPYGGALQAKATRAANERRGWRLTDAAYDYKNTNDTTTYGTHPGQLGALKPGEPPVTTTASGVPVQTWAGCYDSSWKDILFPKAFAHPAKMARGLLERILDFGLAEGFWDKESILGDCFGGVGTTGILCSYRGIRSVSVELEPRFYGLSMATRRLHRHKLARLGCPLPVYLRGDSRHFAALVGQCGAVVTSPPWQESLGSQDKKFRAEGLGQGAGRWAQNRSPESVARLTADYGTTPGNLGNLPAGTLDGAVTSPPYEDGLGHGGKHCPLAEEKRLPAALANNGYGTPNLSGQTYWQAVAAIYAQVRLALKPGGVLAVVVKAFVKDKQIVDLPGQTAQLLTRLGFTVFLEVHASLTHEETHPGLFGSVTRKRERKSFFRRLAEKKGSPPIDHETVLFCRSPP